MVTDSLLYYLLQAIGYWIALSYNHCDDCGTPLAVFATEDALQFLLFPFYKDQQPLVTCLYLGKYQLWKDDNVFEGKTLNEATIGLLFALSAEEFRSKLIKLNLIEYLPAKTIPLHIYLQLFHCTNDSTAFPIN